MPPSEATEVSTPNAQVASTAGKAEVASPAADLSKQTGKPALPQPAQPAATPAPEFGKQFAALGRRESEVKRAEQAARERIAEAERKEKEIAALEAMPEDEFIEYVAKRKGKGSDDIIKGYIAKKTGQPTGEEAIKGSKDPAVQALYEQLEAEKRERAKLVEELETEKKTKAELAAQANVQMVQNECLQSAAAAWKEDETSTQAELSDIYDDQAALAADVLSYCAEQVTAYEKRHGFSPDEEDIAKLIKATPELLLAKLRETPRGKKITALKTGARGGQKPPLGEPSKVGSVRMKPVPKDGERPDSPQPIRTRFDNSDAIARARATIPEQVTFTGRGKSGAA